MKPHKRLIRVGKIKKDRKKEGKEIVSLKTPFPNSKTIPSIRKIVINTCYGGFGLSHQAIMEYYKRKGIKVYPFVEKRDKSGNLDFNHFVPYVEGEKAYTIHYSSEPLNKDGSYDPDSYLPQGREMARDDPALVAIVEEMGDKSWGNCAELSIVEIPDDVEWEVEEYDGTEWIAETHRTWR